LNSPSRTKARHDLFWLRSPALSGRGSLRPTAVSRLRLSTLVASPNADSTQVSLDNQYLPGNITPVEMSQSGGHPAAFFFYESPSVRAQHCCAPPSPGRHPIGNPFVNNTYASVRKASIFKSDWNQYLRKNQGVGSLFPFWRSKPRAKVTLISIITEPVRTANPA
jgi:hypothetical protein